MKKKFALVDQRGHSQPYSEFDEEQLKDYHLQAVRKHWGNEQVTPTKEQEPGTRTLNSVGRPPLSDTLMTPNTLKERKKVLTASKWKKIKLSETRRKTILKRWNSEKGEDVDDHTTVNDSDSIDDSKTSSDDNDEGSNADEGDDPAIAISRATVYHYKAHLLSMFVTNPVDNISIYWN